MKRILLSLPAILLLLILPGFRSTELQMPTSEEDPYSIWIEQEGAMIPIEAGEQVIVLKPSEFRFAMEFAQGEGIYLSASFDDYYYDLKPGEEIKDWEYIKAKVMAEPRYNAEKQLLVDAEAICYWYFDTKRDWHRLDEKVKVKKGRVKASKTIGTLYDVDNKALIPLTECKDTLYLFCFHLVEGPMGKPEMAIARKKAKLVFG